jgi:uncharacterized membrane protein
MHFQFTHPWLLLLLPLAAAWVVWLWLKSDVQTSAWRRWVMLVIRLLVLLAVCCALAGLRWLHPLEGLNAVFLLDRSDSVPSAQQEQAREFINKSAAQKKKEDQGGVVVFGAEASLETHVDPAVDVKKIQAVVDPERTDIAAAVRLGTAAFPETGQKRLVLLSDGNENLGDALAAVLTAKPLGVSVDVVPMGSTRGNDVSVQKLSLPSKLKKGATFDTKIFLQSDHAGPATLRLYRNDQPLGESKLDLQAGKNLFTFPQTLTEPGFYSYDARIEAEGDPVPQNNRASAFTTVQGDPRLLIVASEPEQNQDLAAALRAAHFDVKLTGLNGFPQSLAEMQSYDAIFLANVEAGAMGAVGMAQLESAVRDFGVGLVCIGGDRAFAAGGYRNTPMETTLPLSMELDSKKVLPPGAVVLIMHGMEFNNGNQVARDCAIGVLNALGPQDEMGVLLWDGTEHWLFDLQKVGNKKKLGSLIAGMNQGDLGSFQNIVAQAQDALKKSRASLKHIIVFSDGDPAPPTDALLNNIVNNRITVSTVLISGHAGSETMERMASLGKGRFYNVASAADLPQIFIKETAVVLKSAIYEEPFRPLLKTTTEVVRGLDGGEYPQLLGYVATTQKPRAETPLWTPQGDPLLAHWQYGLGRAVAFTSDASAKWARDWLGWAKYRQFWSQIAQWSRQNLESADLQSEVLVDKNGGLVNVEAVDAQGNYRNFLNLRAVVASPKGERQTVRLEQTGPGHYEVRFPTREVGTYMVIVQELKDGRLRGSQVVGASVSYSPEFSEPQPNFNLLRRLAESSGGHVLDPRNPADNPFLHDRQKTYQPRDLWEWLLKFAVVLFCLDVGVRRIQIEREEWVKVTSAVRRTIFFWRGVERPKSADESLAALLARREAVRESTTGAGESRPELFQPERPTDTPLVLPTQSAEPQAVAEKPAETPAAKPPEPGSTASRLLAAKRKAHKKPE